jgi:ketosteroid isomerase-like protein
MTSAVSSRSTLPAWEAEIRECENRACAAFLAADMAAMDELFADDFVVNSPLQQIATKQQVLGLLAAGRIRHTAYECSIEHISRHGETAVVMGRDRVEGPPHGGVAHRRFTDIWRLEDGRWRCFARHAHVVTQEPA